MEATKALLVFCEGPHDVAFVKQIFKYHFAATKAAGIDGDGLKFSEYPAPFNNLFRVGVEKHAAKDLSLDMAHKFFLPDRTLTKDDWIILLFNTGGKNQIDKTKSFLIDFLSLSSEASIFPGDASSSISEVKYLFLYDADYQLPNDIAVWMQNHYKTISGTEWNLEEWSIDSKKRGVTQDDKALYVWAGEDGKGTLEDILLPIYKISSNEVVKKSQTFIEDTFSWNLKGKAPKQKYKKMSEKGKAILCAAGQGEKPGKPLSAIINDNVLSNEDDITQALAVREFADFVSNFIAIESESNKETGL